MKLISMTEFVLKTYDEISDSIYSESMMYKYAEFLNQPLTLGMFIPCDEDGNILEEPDYPFKSNSNDLELNNKYQQAKDKVLFEGFEIENGELDRVTNGQVGFYPENFKTIEDLVKYNPTLTPNAIKQLKL